MATQGKDIYKIEDGPPPAYSPAGNSPPTYSNEPPPSYESVFGRVRQIRDESDGNADFAKNMMCCVLCGSVCNIFLIIIHLAIPIACLVFGVLYLGECTIQRFIPIYLIVAGVFGLIKAVLGIVKQICKRRSDGDGDEEENGTVRCLTIVDGPISCFLSCWFIAGCVWVYRIHGRISSDPYSPLYCDPTLYAFAFWILTVTYIMLAAILCCTCVGIAVYACVSCKQSSDS